jgi:hypothetical protein
VSSVLVFSQRLRVRLAGSSSLAAVLSSRIRGSEGPPISARAVRANSSSGWMIVISAGNVVVYPGRVGCPALAINGDRDVTWTHSSRTPSPRPSSSTPPRPGDVPRPGVEEHARVRRERLRPLLPQPRSVRAAQRLRDSTVEMGRDLADTVRWRL